MIIKSPFKDYYDHCVGFGVDKAVVFNRQTESMPLRECHKGHSALSDIVWNISSESSQLIDSLVELRGGYFAPVVIGFCGKLYVGLKGYVIESQNAGKVGIRETRVALHEASRLNVKARYYWKPADFSARDIDCEWKTGGYVSLDSRGRAKTVGDWFSRNEKHLITDKPDLFFEHGLTYFVFEQMPGYKSTQVTLNPVLSDYNFQRLMDGVTAFQELSMHIASLNSANVRQPEPITDKLRAMSKGFDDRSFRKAPSREGRIPPKG